MSDDLSRRLRRSADLLAEVRREVIGRPDRDTLEMQEVLKTTTKAERRLRRLAQDIEPKEQ
jgi:hypothetical protein